MGGEANNHRKFQRQQLVSLQRCGEDYAGNIVLRGGSNSSNTAAAQQQQEQRIVEAQQQRGRPSIVEIQSRVGLSLPYSWKVIGIAWKKRWRASHKRSAKEPYIAAGQYMLFYLFVIGMMTRPQVGGYVRQN